jgi:hypothetical protein
MSTFWCLQFEIRHFVARHFRLRLQPLKLASTPTFNLYADDVHTIKIGGLPNLKATKKGTKLLCIVFVATQRREKVWLLNQDHHSNDTASALKLCFFTGPSWKTNEPFQMQWKTSEPVRIRVAGFFLTLKYQNGKNIPKGRNYTKRPFDIPNGRKIYNHFLIQRHSKMYPNWDFWS